MFWNFQYFLLKTKTQANTLFFFIFDAPQDQNFDIEDYITGQYISK